MVSSQKEKKILHMEQTLSGNNMKPDKKRKIIWKEIILEQPTVKESGESRYLTPLWVSANVDEPRKYDSSQSLIIGSDSRSDFLYHQEIKNKIRAALKRLSFREQHVLVQFWLPRDVGKHQLLTTNDQPFGVGVVSDELCFYRRDSEQYVFLVNKDHDEEEDLSPSARVFRRGLPEWTCDVANYDTKHFPQQECAIRCNLHGYLALPVFDSTVGLCVGVLELLTSVKYTSYAFEVQQVHKALKVENLSSPKVFNSNIPKVLCERRKRNRIDSLTMKALKQLIDKPLDQTAQSLEVTTKRFCQKQRMNNVHDSKEEVSDNFTIEKNNLLKQVRKRKRDSDLVLSTMEVIVYVTFNKSMERFAIPLSHGLSNLKNKVAKRFELDGEKLLLKYVDEDGDLILICPQDDLRSALDASGYMKLICSLED